MDDGYPQILAPEALKLYITQEGVRSELAPFEVKARSLLGVRLACSMCAISAR